MKLFRITLILLCFNCCNLEIIPDEIVGGSISVLNCSDATASGTLISGQAATNITVFVPYTGGDGGTHSGQTVLSTGVTGLTAKLDAGSFDTGTGILDYAVSGTPSASGNAIFSLNIGGKTCLLSVPVQALNGSITGLNCSGATVNGALYVNQAASNVTVTLPYSGGNGGTYGEQTVQSSGVTGLQAKLLSGSFVSGSGNLSYAISGTPSSAGTASFALNIGGINCTVAVPVNVGSIGNLDCQNIALSGTLTAGQAVNSVTVTVPYTGGNGGTHTGQTVNSSTPGVLGLTATLVSGSFSSGSGTLVYTITGTPSTSGSAMFALNIGGIVCTISLTVQAAAGTISALNCSGATVNGALYVNQAASNVSVSVPYTGGNGGTYSEQMVQSSGVTGLEAKLMSGSFASGSGNLSYAISGTPSSTGTATFALNIGGIMCNISINVTGGGITGIFCSSIIYSGYLVVDKTATNVTVKVPYSGGTGSAYSERTITSTGVDNLTAHLPPGNFLIGSGYLTFTISGVPSNPGTASFFLNIGGQSCTLNIPVGCGAFVAPGQFKEFMCFNLGSANTDIDPFVPSWEINGGYWQWGRIAQAASGPTGSGASEANSGDVTGWSNNPASNGSWSDSFKSVEDPCPPGFRVPTITQWNGVYANNTWAPVGTWSSSATNYSCGNMFGEMLFLPATGYRNANQGFLDQRGNQGCYWSSTESASNRAWYLRSGSGNSNDLEAERTWGRSVRCIAE